MIRLSKPVKLYEWGEGTNTVNQVWRELGQGKIVSSKRKDLVTTLTVELGSAFNKGNARDNAIKLAQQGEGMTARSDKWGEVAIGRLKSVEGGRSIVIEIPVATKISK